MGTLFLIRECDLNLLNLHFSLTVNFTRIVEVDPQDGVITQCHHHHVVIHYEFHDVAGWPVRIIRIMMMGR